eukprot:TRINITY_DN19584_c0_g1_i1.p1 TRINITY_DN19584_c0_g1~~TRINITY_DN19584_c0_g1_i1.p1  ORF type:complete len:288 (-),score=113.65 TRINITY_DN19584_c0_g1_i1:26-844(-)
MSTRQFEGADHSSLYAKFRPVPPLSILTQILKFRERASPPLNLAVDVGCGSGQFTRLLPPVCTSVLATDVSQVQVDQARNLLHYDNLEVKVGRGEKIEVEDSSVDLVTVCQALHWMEVEEFYAEVSRILVPGGTLAVIGYHFTRPAPTMSNSLSLTEAMMKVYRTTGPYWSSRRALVDSGYTSIPLAQFERVERQDDEHYTDIQATLADWTGYIRSWSGLQTFAREKGSEAAGELMEEFERTCAELMEGRVEDSDKIQLHLRTQYWTILYQK